VNGLKDIHVHSLLKKKILYKLNGVSKKENSITKILLVPEYRYVVTGYNNG
jgi:hypothetical protein